MGYFTDRLDIPVPSDKEEAAADDLDGARTFQTTSINWGDSYQTVAALLDANLGRVDIGNNQPPAGATAAIWWLLTDAGPNDLPLFQFNDGTEWRTVGRYLPGGDVTVPDGEIEQGSNPAETVTENFAPTGFTFTGSAGRDILEQIDIDVENTTTGGVAENVTVTVYDGTSAAGTQIGTQTQTVTVDAQSVGTATFLASERSLDDGDYYVEITTSGTTLNITETRVVTTGLVFSRGQQADGSMVLRDEIHNRDLITADPLTGVVDIAQDLTVAGAPVEGGGGLDPAVAETITARWTFSGGLTASTTRVDDAGDGFETGVVSGRPRIAPRVDTTQRDDREITFDPVAGEWDIEGTPRAGGSPIVTEADYSYDAVRNAVGSPESFQTANLDAGESTEKGYAVGTQQQIKIYYWGVYQLPNQPTNTDLWIEFLGPDDTIIASSGALRTMTTNAASPLHSSGNSTGSTAVFKIRLRNTGAVAYSDVGGAVGVVIE